MIKSEMSNDKLKRLRNRYLDLMQSCLTGCIYRDTSLSPVGSKPFNAYIREHGLDWPSTAQTMIGTKRMANLRELTEAAIADNVPGDFVETGVWRGGACIFMRAVLYAHGITDRCVWAADSFQGLPEGDTTKYPADEGSDFHTYEQLAVSLEQVQENFRAYGLLDEQTRFLKGWFKDTLPDAPFGPLALIRLDGDMYESTMDALSNLYPKLSHRGFVIIDDYHFVPACKAAVQDYCRANGIQPQMAEIDGVGVYWRKLDETGHSCASAGQSRPGISPENQITRLNEALVELSGQIMAHLNQALAQRDIEVERLTNVLADRKSDVDRLTHQLDAVFSSTIWRVTRPVRLLKQWIIRSFEKS